MQTKHIKYLKSALLLTLILIVGAGIFFTSCEKEDKEDDTIVLNSFGPMPIARGAELRFIGNNLDKVTAVIIPENIEITEFGTKTSTLLSVTVPQTAVEGYIVLKTSQGDITTKTKIGFSEPISIDKFSPSLIKADSVLTITGDYLNLVKEVIFTDRVSVVDTLFISQSREQITLKVPAEAQTGKIAVSNGAQDPIIVYSEGSLSVKLPAFSSVSPNPVKAGSNLTITGTDLDLVKTIELGGDKIIGDTSFTSQSATQIVITVPSDAQDGKVIIIPASGVEVESSTDLVMVVPTVSVTPTTLKNGNTITVTGTNLDLINKVIFGGDFEGTINAGGTTTQIEVIVPDEAISGTVKFVTLALKEVSGPSLTLTDPVFTSFSPATIKPKNDITIDGTDLDLVVDVRFVGDISGSIVSKSETQLTVKVPVGAKDGKITLVAKNGTQVQSSGDISILVNLPDITGYKEASGRPGSILTIRGTNLLLIKELIFPDNISATQYGTKIDTMIEVYVPDSVVRGYGNITMITYDGDEGITPEIYFGGTDPIVDPSLMINDFEPIDGHDLSWDNWSGVSELGSDPAKAISGNYLHGADAAMGDWKWIWGCNHDQLPKVSVTKADHLLKMDINITSPLSSPSYGFSARLGGTEISLGKLGIDNGDGTYSTPDWITISFDLSTFDALPDIIPTAGDWGMTYWSDASEPIDFTAVYIDNIRFEHK